MGAIKEKLYNLKTFPSYFGRTIVPETQTAAKLYSGFVKTLNADENKKRKALAKKINTPPAERMMTKDNGYLIFNGQHDPLFQDAIKHAQAEASALDWDALGKKSKKPFLINQPIDYKDPKHIPLLKFATSDLMLEPVTNYIGRLPVLALVSLWYSPNVENETTRSRAYHLDGPDYRQVKCFIPLDTVDEETGPLCFIPARKSQDIYNKLCTEKTISAYYDRVTDEQMYAHYPQEEVIKATGEVGTVCMVDTNTCYHYGSRKASKPRLLLVVQYLDPYCSSLPAWNRKNRDFKALEGAIDSDRIETLLGLAHLEFRNAYPPTNPS